MDEVIKEHAARVREADPLVAGHDQLPVPGPGEELVEVAGGVGLAWVDRVDPGSVNACWSPLTVHRLQARVAGPDPAGVLGGLVDRWIERVETAADAGDAERALSISWPSRDTAPLRALALRGFAPLSAMAVRGVGESGVGESGVGESGV
ncbi:hypothetical protein HII36_26720, partial [Nonomuraea sp. NN258]|uniref:hypothetical protein n=1 Tax=Nonomuraea antri TaxID=2730852 RepID=UPI001C2BE467